MKVYIVVVRIEHSYTMLFEYMKRLYNSEAATSSTKKKVIISSFPE